MIVCVNIISVVVCIKIRLDFVLFYILYVIWVIFVIIDKLFIRIDFVNY